MIQLHEVFGVGRGVPRYTYVDRSGLDARFNYLLGTERHIVVHGASKQGKSCLRRKNLNEANCIIVQCSPEMSNKNLWQNALRQLNACMTSSESETKQIGGSIGGHIQSDLNAFIIKSEGKLESTISSNSENNRVKSYVSGKEDDLDFLSAELKKHKKRLVLEDFHYLSESFRRKVAFDLKALYELGIYVIVIGIWSEQNLLTYYNGDLTGRIEEININWNGPELDEVLQKGEKTLNIEFSKELKKSLIESSFQNVGLLQRTAEKLCFTNGILTTQKAKQILIPDEMLQSAITQVIADIGQRYTRICEVFVKGFRSDTKLRIYYKIFRVLTKIDERYLINGTPYDMLLKMVQEESTEEVRPSDLTQCLDRIERLQATRQITPLLVSYNKNLKLLALMDREFLFFRKHGSVDWEELVPE
ncbi:MAG: hypothetical protein JW727_04090 [Candidatus Aenigmarchaeota archaeon]|nr:hypothetical protein [Candidatus Aenigmarchaeota archaeon]